MQAPPSLDEDNFPSLATSPSPSTNGVDATAASVASPAANGNATAVGASSDSSPAESPTQVKDTSTASTSASGATQNGPAKNGPALPAAWGAAAGYAHKAAVSGKSSTSDTAWNKTPQQKVQTGSKLQPDAANFKPKGKSIAAKIPWVETGRSHLLPGPLPPVCTVRNDLLAVLPMVHLLMLLSNLSYCGSVASHYRVCIGCRTYATNLCFVPFTALRI